MTEETTKVMRVYESDINKVYKFGIGGDSIATCIRKLLEKAETEKE